jgi:very-short-patch-repair endonuclease
MAAPPKKLALAKRMRRNPTQIEAKLWTLLRGWQLEAMKFRRQVPIGRFVVDFLCLRHRLIVEADSEYFHDAAKDAERDAWLASQGFRVLRFMDSEIRSRPEAVLVRIAEAAGRKSPTPLDPSSDPALAGPPSPARGEG